MRRRGSYASGLSIALLASACAAITGLDGYTVGDDASVSSSSTSGEAGGPLPPDVVVPGPDGGLPADCKDGQVACAGSRLASACVGGAWTSTPCEGACKDGVCEAYPSCRNAQGTGCGAAPTSCCASRPVPGGTFLRRSDASLPATLSPFELDVFEVTVGRFRAFVAAGGATRANVPTPGSGAHPKVAGSGWHAEWNLRLPLNVAELASSLKGGQSTWTDAVGPNEHLPINNIQWHQAFAFCAWDGARLPTFAELSFAATGGAEQRNYPWSKPPSSTTISELPALEAAFNCNFKAPARSCSTTTCSGCGLEDIAPVGSLPAGAGRWGQLDLAGNVEEWTLDLSDRFPPPICNDCAVVSTTDDDKGEFLVLGGSWDRKAVELRTDRSDRRSSQDRKDTQGIRCAR